MDPRPGLRKCKGGNPKSVGVRQLCLRRIGVRGQKSLKTAALRNKHTQICRFKAMPYPISKLKKIGWVITLTSSPSKMFDVGDLPVMTFGNCVLQTGVISVM